MEKGEGKDIPETKGKQLQKKKYHHSCKYEISIKGYPVFGFLESVEHLD